MIAQGDLGQCRRGFSVSILVTRADAACRQAQKRDPNPSDDQDPEFLLSKKTTGTGGFQLNVGDLAPTNGGKAVKPKLAGPHLQVRG